jgi:hypothetical protein
VALDEEYERRVTREQQAAEEAAKAFGGFIQSTNEAARSAAEKGMAPSVNASEDSGSDSNAPVPLPGQPGGAVPK